MKIWFRTFGCRVNQYETQALRERLLSQETAREAEDFEAADLCVVNTCAVTEEADKEALKLVRRIARRNPAARLVVTGCLATAAPERILEAAPAALVVGNDRKEALPAMLGCRTAGGLAGVTGLHERSRAFVKIQDGCNMTCAFCIIPSLRPDMSSRPVAALEAEVRGLVERGHAEIVLCGIRLGRYLVEDEEGKRVDFTGLLERLAGLPGDFRIRLSSFEITDVTDRFIALAASAGGRVCPSFHLPLQSGSEGVLKRMRRWYSAAFYRRRVEALKAKLPSAGLFADVIAGFPGESRAEHAESFEFVRGLGYGGLHVFRYSKRRGTVAARRSDHLPERLVLERAEELRALDRELRAAFARRAVGQDRLVVATDAGRGEALAEDFLSVRTQRPLGPGLHPVRVTAAEGAAALARPVGDVAKDLLIAV